MDQYILVQYCTKESAVTQFQVPQDNQPLKNFGEVLV